MFKNNSFLLAFCLFISFCISFALYIVDFKSLSFIFSFSSILFYSYATIKVRHGNIIQLDLFFLFFLFIYSVTLPFSDFISPIQSMDSSIVETSYTLCLLSLIGFSFGCMLFSYGRSDKKNFIHIGDVGNNIDEKRLRRSGYILFLLGFLFSIVAVQTTVGFSNYLSAGYAGRALIKREAGPIELGLYIAVVGVVVVYSAMLLSKSPSRKDRLIVYIFIAFFFAYVSYLGVRRPTFLLLLALFSCYSLLRKNVSVGVLLAISIPFFLFFTTFAQYRQVISSDGLLYTIDFIAENISPEWFDFSETELGAPIKTLYDNLTLNELSLDFGYSYISSFLYVLPSFINGGMKSLSVEYTHKFFSQDFISIGGNMGFFPVTEAYVNFGVTGTVIVFVFLAILLCWMNEKLYLKMSKSPFWVIFCAILIPWFAFFMRLDFSSFMKGFLYSQLIPLLLSWFLYRYKLRLR
ncbi:hypothetical protein DC364_20190 [Vibrio vulnificus]|uniref:O-antigen polymerase n=1 Tax=Vibrio vulnificus TaxID=672 RepID=UPI000D3EA53C|nr:O-antigen polymerase [Vibrio vulnificus]PUZ91971.1 hypothetical protein DC364_20190 [Vibrio vulnificus]HAS6040075.1 O-antigen polysaccharide polymerase Wzy [Vibrio vulnificus]HAS6119842.1 O-antigen polysaccharide polymerase Wzy [Vibrio vulnificus]